MATGRRGADGMAGLAVDVGYADQAHLSPERFHLSRLTLRQLIGSSFGRCLRTHEHAASYQPFSPPAPGGRSVPDLLDSFKTGATPAPRVELVSPTQPTGTDSSDPPSNLMKPRRLIKREGER
jgi:hypothetical protein